MNWKELLKSEIECTYKVTERLLDLVDEGSLDWRPSAENNWMTMGQLLMHIATACGAPIGGFITGDWGMPDGVDLADLSPEDMLPPAEKLPALGSVQEAKELLAKDKHMAAELYLVAIGQDPRHKHAGTVHNAPVRASHVHKVITAVAQTADNSVTSRYFRVFEREIVRLAAAYCQERTARNFTLFPLDLDP